MIDRDRVDPRVARADESRRIGAVGDHHGDRRVEPAVPDGIDQRLQVAAAPGDEDAERAT